MAGVTLSVLPFGAAQAPFFDGALRSVLTVPDDPHYSQPFAKALTVSAWLCPLALNNANVVGGQDKYVHYVEKAVGSRRRRVGAQISTISSIRPAIHVSRSIRSTSDHPRARAMAPTWNMASRRTMRRPSRSGNGCSWLARPSPGFRKAIFRQAARSGNKASPRGANLPINTAISAYSHSRGPARLRSGSQETGFQGAIAHLAIWNRLLSGDEIASIWSAGAGDLGASAMYHSFS